jgi:hypothetical protein
MVSEDIQPMSGSYPAAAGAGRDWEVQSGVLALYVQLHPP